MRNRRLWRTPVIGVLALLLLRVSISPVAATEYSGTQFKVIDPVISVGGARVASTTYTVISSFGQLAVGTSTSNTYRVRSGFEFFPVATAPVLTATAGAAQVSLSWTASTGFLGWTVTSYDVCRGTSSNSYTCTDVGNVTSNTVTGLTAGTTYYFRIRAKTTFSVVIVRSNEATATPTAGAGGGGGGNVGIPSAPTAPAATGSVLFSGKAYPNGAVNLLKDGQHATSVRANAQAEFRVSLSNLTPGNYLFALSAVDSDGLRSNLISFPITVTSGSTTTVSDIFIPPTIFASQSEVKQGEPVEFFGHTVPRATVTISVNSDESGKEVTLQILSQDDGRYEASFNSAELEFGSYTARAKASTGNEVSSYSYEVSFIVGTRTVLAEPSQLRQFRADFNNDGRVGLVDFSILLYWFERPDPPAQFDLNSDKTVDIIDFSIMMYEWTG